MQAYLALCSVPHRREQSCSLVTHTELTLCLLYVSGTVLCAGERAVDRSKAKPTSPVSWRLHSGATGAPRRGRTHAEGCSKLGPGRTPGIAGSPSRADHPSHEALRSQIDEDATPRSEWHKATTIPKGWRGSHSGCHAKTRSQGRPAGAGTMTEAALWEQGPGRRSLAEGAGAAEEPVRRGERHPAHTSSQLGQVEL